jgi:hypothetical protein
MRGAYFLCSRRRWTVSGGNEGLRGANVSFEEYMRNWYKRAVVSLSVRILWEWRLGRVWHVQSCRCGVMVVANSTGRTAWKMVGWEKAAIISLYSINGQDFRRVRKIVKGDLLARCLSVFPLRTTQFPKDGFSLNLFEDFRKSVEKIKISLNSDKSFTFMIISLWILLRMRNVSDKSCLEN